MKVIMVSAWLHGFPPSNLPHDSPHTYSIGFLLDCILG